MWLLGSILYLVAAAESGRVEAAINIGGMSTPSQVRKAALILCFFIAHSLTKPGAGTEGT